jgi:hypothetical protein
LSDHIPHSSAKGIGTNPEDVDQAEENERFTERDIGETTHKQRLTPSEKAAIQSAAKQVDS